jgi:cytosine/uracil/thiamine/allantoin permease
MSKEELVELTADVSGSPLYNEDLAPTTIKQRTWSTYNFAALWISMAHCIPTYMLSSSLDFSGNELAASNFYDYTGESYCLSTYDFECSSGD